jgi:predicted transcriptional regulator
MMTGAQIRSARALIGLDQKKLADLAGISVPTIRRMEAKDGMVGGMVESLVKVLRALNSCGVEIIADGAASDGGGVGVRLAKSTQTAVVRPAPQAALLEQQ